MNDRSHLDAAHALDPSRLQEVLADVHMPGVHMPDVHLPDMHLADVKDAIGDAIDAVPAGLDLVRSGAVAGFVAERLGRLGSRRRSGRSVWFWLATLAGLGGLCWLAYRWRQRSADAKNPTRDRLSPVPTMAHGEPVSDRQPDTTVSLNQGNGS